MVKKYRTHLCLNGRKDKEIDTWEYDDRREWQWDKELSPCDIIDETDTEIWFDWGDE